MKFFAALGRLLSGGSAPAEPGDRERLLRAWDLHEAPEDETSDSGTSEDRPAPAEEPDLLAGADATHTYDRQQWQRRLRTILDRLPDSRDQWEELTSDIGALGLDPAWVRDVERREFVLLVRRAVADRHVTPAEHHKLDAARLLLGMSEEDAEAILTEIVGEAEAFFGRPVEDDR